MNIQSRHSVLTDLTHRAGRQHEFQLVADQISHGARDEDRARFGDAVSGVGPGDGENLGYRCHGSAAAHLTVCVAA